MPTSRLRLLQVITSNHRRGAETFAWDLDRALSKLDTDVRTVALTPSNGTNPLPVEVLGPSRWSSQTLRALRRAAKNTDVVIAHGSSTLAACALSTTGIRTPFIYRLIGDPSHWTASISRRVRVAVLLHRAAAVVTYFPSASRVIRDRYHLAPDRVSTIPKGVFVSDCPKATLIDKRRARESLGVGVDDLVVGFVGALSIEKRPELAIDATKLIDSAHLIVAGEGPLQPELELRADSIANRVRFLGSVANPNIVYAASDVIVLTSSTEGVPGVLIEAALAGRPVVATDVGGVREVVIDGQTGIVLRDATPEAIAAAIRTAAADGVELGNRAHARAIANFNICSVAADWLKLAISIAT